MGRAAGSPRELGIVRFRMSLLGGRTARSGGTDEAIQRSVAALPVRALGILDPAERSAFMEKEVSAVFGLRRAWFLLPPQGPERFSSESTRIRDLFSRVTGIIAGTGLAYLDTASAKKVGAEAMLRSLDATYALPISRGGQPMALLIVDSSPAARLPPHREDLLLQAVGQVGVVLENSALLQGKLELERTLARQAQIVQLGEMTARIAHEIKNPLSSIKTIVQVMREEPATSSLHGRDLELIEGEVNRLSATVTQLLNFARPGREAQDRVRLRQAVEATVSFLQHDIRRMGARIENEVPEDLPAIEGSEAAFREILLNLILNSIQAGGGGMRVRLQGWLGMFEDGSEEFVVFIVEDDGPGVPADLQERVFQPFFTTKQRGTGLGLAIVRRNVEQMGGRIALESPARQGNGTRFIIHLPLRPRAAPEQARPYRNGS